MKASQNKDFDNFKYNIVGCTNEYRFKAVLYVFILMLSCLVAVGIYMLQRNIRQRIKTPKNIEVFGSSDSSITVEWDINESDNCLEYKLLYRPEGSDNWEEKLLSSTDVSTNKNRRCRYKIEALPPGTLFEFKMCSVENQVKSVFTKSIFCQTLKLAPKNIEVFGSSDSSITVEWDINESDNCLEYKLLYRPKGSDNWEEKLLSLTDVSTNKNGRCRYNIETLPPGTLFEFKMCSFENQANSVYTKSTFCQTPKLAPKNIEVFGSSDSSITVEWDINESDNCLEYKLLYRPEGSDNWEEKLLSSTDVSTNKNRRCRYKIEALPPGTLFEFKMCSVENQVNSVYTKSTICQTLKLAPRNFDVFESTESSITVEWDILESNNCLEYELMYRPDHTDEWKEQFSSVKDVPTKKNGRYMYKIENLSSDTRFEVKMCCGENKRNSHYTRHVSCKTLKHGNEDVTEEGTRSKDQVMQELLKRTDSVPSNIREQMRIRINEWEDNSKNFVITKAYNTILEKIRSIDCVAVTGSSGSGKSAIVRQVSLTLCRDDGFEIITISTPVELKTYYTPGRKTMFVLEDLCGKFTANEGQINGWDLMKDVVDQVIKDSSCKLLFSCRLQVFHDPKFSMLQLFKSCECNLISDELCLDTDEKKKIFKSYFGSETTEDDILLSSNVNYPLLCQQMSIREDNPDIAKYFKTPYCAYKTELEELTIHAPLKICGLCLCIMFNNQLKERDFKILSSDFKTVVNDICEFFGLQLTPATSIRKELDIPDKTFVNKQDGVYKICHDNLFDFMAYYFGTLIPKCFIDHADSSFLRERFLWEKNIQSDKSSIENIVHLDDDFLVLYIDRLISDWLKGKVSDVFYNINMKYISFRKEFLKGLKRIDRNKATDLANIKDAFRDDFASGNTPLIISCLYGDVDLMKWLLEHSAKVNVQRDDGASALCMACEKNHEDAVSILLENNAKVNLCTEEGASPLGIACFFHGNSNIIRQLLKRNPDVNEFRLKKNNMTPLFMACKQNFNSAASLLLEHNADHRICLNNGMSALLMACHNRNTDIVRLLLQEGANPDAQKNDGNTPLFSAAAMGLDIITDLLLQNNADIYKYVYSKEYILQAFERSPDSLDRVKKFWVGTGKKYGSPATKKFISDIGTNALDYVFDVVAGSSPLHVACFMGQIKIVEKLIRTMPQVDLKKKQNGITPLFYACEIGHLVIIRSLLEKGADPTSCTGNQCSPLDKAKSNKHADVLLLLNSSHK